MKGKLNYNKVLRAFVFLCLIVVIIVCCFELKKYIIPKDTTVIEEKPNGTDDNKIKEYSLSMAMVGDLIVHANVYIDAKINNTYDFSPMFTDVKDFITSHDLAFYNQETPFGGKELGYSGYPIFNTPSEVGDEMLHMGFNLISLANNHTMDKGERGAVNSLKYWNSKDVMTAGSYLSEEDRKKINIQEKNGITYTMLAYGDLTNRAIPYGKPYLLNMYDKNKVKEDIERVRDKVDLLIVSMHWGIEYALQPSNKQKEIAAYLASLGVDIIIGHHTHSVQPIEYIDGTLVIYSLGNFISSQLYDDNLVGLMTSLKVTKRVEQEKVTINLSDLEARLIYTYYKGGRTMQSIHTDHRVIPFDKLTINEFPKYEEFYNKYREVITSMDPTIIVSALNE
ncbi:MAG: CapA family protein [Bacilli bacterium]|nr:CapA family protein [Bacilli bacterium]